ncbi:MAG: hypothetical protein EXS08_11425 [Planctomycetes bacterium]|nr:hypothetical protein [Planctomycetota bacterium]
MNAALLFAARLALPALAGQIALEPALVKLERQGGLELWTVRANDCSVRALLARVAELSGRSIDATSALERAPLVSVSLERRPLEDVLEYALGSAGLTVALEGQAILVRGEQSASATPDERVARAADAWAHAAARHPRHPIAAAARLAQGELEELRGRDEAARARYLDVLERSPAAPGSGEAYLRAGRIAAQRGDWREASEHFRALANLAGADEYSAVARLELARATLRLGDAAGALHILDALDQAQPGWEPSEQGGRTLLRVDVLLALERFQDAADLLEARAEQLDPLSAREVATLRARALEGAGFPEEASRAWLLAARDALAPARAEAYRAAVRASEQARDPLGVLYAAREAQAAGFGALVAEAAARARITLGVRAQPDGSTPASELRIATAERWLDKRELERAADELAPLFAERERLALAPAVRARLTVAWARCLAQTQGLEPAADMARAERTRLEDPDARTRLDRGIAHLFEEHALFERAADAYQGDY